MSWDGLQKAFPWSDSKPEVVAKIHGWVVHEAAWRRILGTVHEPVVLELGAWTGKTSDWLLSQFPQLRLIACDIWERYGELNAYYDLWEKQGVLGNGYTSYDIYAGNIWRFRDRVVMLRAYSVPGMEIVGHHLQPTHVYIDADHRYESAKADALAACALFPQALVCGDDYEMVNESAAINVQKAIDEVAVELGKTVKLAGRFWWYE